MTNEQQLFDGLNMNPSRDKDEMYKDYVIRRKKVKFILKKYKEVGRTTFQSIFPEGVTIESMDSIVKAEQEK